MFGIKKLVQKFLIEGKIEEYLNNCNNLKNYKKCFLNKNFIKILKKSKLDEKTLFETLIFIFNKHNINNNELIKEIKNLHNIYK